MELNPGDIIDYAERLWVVHNCDDSNNIVLRALIPDSIVVTTHPTGVAIINSSDEAWMWIAAAGVEGHVILSEETNT